MDEIPEVDTVELLTRKAKADLDKFNAGLERDDRLLGWSEQQVWRVPADDGSGDVVIQPAAGSIPGPPTPTPAGARIAELLKTAESQWQYLVHLGDDVVVCPGEQRVAHDHLQQLRRQFIDEHRQATGRDPETVPWLIGVYPPNAVGGPEGRGGVRSFGYQPTLWGHIDLPRDQWVRLKPPLSEW